MERGFLDGYQAARLEQRQLAKLKRGEISAHDDEVAWLFDVGHPENPYNRGLQIGQLAG
jgi:hypothetical protein